MGNSEHHKIEVNTGDFWKLTLSLCLGSFLIFASIYTTQPLLPLLKEGFGLSTLEAGYTFTLTTLTLSLSLLVIGPISDTVGRKPIIVFSMIGVVVTTCMLAWVESFAGLVALRAVQGVFLAGLPVIAMALMVEELSTKAFLTAAGFYIAANTLGGVGGRLIAGIVGDYWGWQAAFGVMAFVGVVCTLAVIVFLPNSRCFEAKPVSLIHMLAGLLSHLRQRVMVLAFAIGGLNFFIFVNQFSYAAYRLDAAPYQLSTSWIGALFLTYLAGTFGASISGRMCLRFPSPLVMAFGIVLMAIGSLVTLHAQLAMIVLGFLLSCLGFFLTHSTASAWVSRKAVNARASASALYLFFYYVGASTGGFYLDMFWRHFHWAGVVVGSLCVLGVTFLLALWLYRSSPRTLLS